MRISLFSTLWLLILVPQSAHSGVNLNRRLATIIDEIQPSPTLFEPRGTAEASFSNVHQPANIKGSNFRTYNDPFGIISYTDQKNSNLSYSLYVTSSGGIWKMDKMDGQGKPIEYIGGYHYCECPGGKLHTSDRMIMPAIGLNLNHATEGGAYNSTLRTNYGCQTKRMGQPWPVNNYQGAASGRGELSRMIEAPKWDRRLQRAYFRTRPFPWIFYKEIFDANSPAFQADFVNYGNKTLIQQQFLDALENVELENVIQIQPDGTIMYAWMWTFLKDTSWGAYTTEGLWTGINSSEHGFSAWYDESKKSFVESSDKKGLNGVELQNSSGWAGMFTNDIQPNIGLGFFFGKKIAATQAGISLIPGRKNHSPAVFATNTFPTSKRLGKKYTRILRVMYFKLGDKQSFQDAQELLDAYTFYKND